MEKQELLELVEKQELNRIDNLSEDELWTEFLDYVMSDQSEEEIAEYKNKTRIELINIYMEDFMTWKQDYSIDQLEEILEVQNAKV